VGSYTSRGEEARSCSGKAAGVGGEARLMSWGETVLKLPVSLSSVSSKVS
jgi:hypothetical protein